MIRRISYAAAVMIFSIASAHAQPDGAKMGSGPMGKGGGGVSPVIMTCGPDLKKFCGGQRGMPGVQCLMENITDLSEPCADALDEASANMGQRHGNTDDAED
jgi:hypothetical protein